MNGRVDLPTMEPAGTPAPAPQLVPEPEQVREALSLLLASPFFRNAPRMSDLLAFLVEKKLAGKEQEITEYAIGLHVFRRDARVYDTALDPVVRVQVGRLRDRLAAYYAAAGMVQPLRIAIPAGSYVPVLQPLPLAGRPPGPRVLEWSALRDLTGDARGATFVAGVNEELQSQLFRLLGCMLQVRHPGIQAWMRIEPSPQLSRRIEGSVRCDAHRVRASLRVIDNVTGRVEWASQFDCHGELGLALQEQLADAVCERLQGYLAD